MKLYYYCLCLVFLVSCKPKVEYDLPIWEPYDESAELAANSDHMIGRMQYKLIQSQVLDKNKVWDVVRNQLKYFSPEDYERLKPMILEQDIPGVQPGAQVTVRSRDPLS